MINSKLKGIYLGSIIIIVAIIQIGCDFFGNKPHRELYENADPEVTGALNLGEVSKNASSRSFLLSDLFFDKNEGDALSYDIFTDDISENEPNTDFDSTVVSVRRVGDDMILVTPKGVGESTTGKGEAIIRITASNNNGGEPAVLEEMVTVKQGPVLVESVKMDFEDGIYTTCDGQITPSLSLQSLFDYDDVSKLNFVILDEDVVDGTVSPK